MCVKAPSRSVNRAPPTLRTRLHHSSRPENRPECESRAPARQHDSKHGRASSGDRSEATAKPTTISESTAKPATEATSSAEACTYEVTPRPANEATSSIQEVSQAVGRIANYFGASAVPGRSDENSERKEDSGTSDANVLNTVAQSTSLGTNTTNVSQNDPRKKDIEKEKDKVESINSSLPSYAPEKCITEVNYPVPSVTSSSGIPQSNTDREESNLPNSSDVVRLKEALVTEKEIFGCPQPADVGQATPGSSATGGEEVSSVVENADKDAAKSDNEEEVTAAAIKELDQMCGLERSNNMDYDIINLIDDDDDDNDDGGDDDVGLNGDGPGESGAFSPGGSDAPIDLDANSIDNLPSDSECNMGTSTEFLKLSSTEDTEENYTEVEYERLKGDWGRDDEEVTAADQGDKLDLVNGVDLGIEEDGNNDDKAVEMDEEYSKEDQKIMEQFQKITAMEESTSVEVGNRKRVASTTEEIEIPVKKRRIAHSQADKIGEREPARVSKPKVKDPNFSSMLKQTDLYMGKKRIANKPAESGSTSDKRPRIPCITNARIPRVVRQKYLDGYIDELLKISTHPKEAYDKALAKEETIFSSCNGRNVYLNKSHAALKALKLEVEEFLKEKKRQSDERVRLNQVAPDVRVVKKKPVSSRMSSSDNDLPSTSGTTLASGSVKQKDSSNGLKGRTDILKDTSIKNREKDSSSHSGKSKKRHDSVGKERKLHSTASSEISSSRRISATNAEKHSNGEFSKLNKRSESVTGKPLQDSTKQDHALHKSKEERKGAFAHPVKAELKHRVVKEHKKSIPASPVLSPTTIDFMSLEDVPTPEVTGRVSKEELQVASFYGKKSKEAKKKDLAKGKDKASKKVEAKHSSVKLSSTDWLSEISHSTLRTKKKHRSEDKKEKRKSSTNETREDKGQNPQNLNTIDKVSCTSSLPGSSGSCIPKEPSSLPGEDISQYSTKHRITKNLQLTLTPESTKQFRQAGEVARKPSVTPSTPSSSSHKVMSRRADLRSELFGSDDDDFIDAHPSPLFPSRNSIRRPTVDSAMDDSSSSEDCFVVGSPDYSKPEVRSQEVMSPEVMSPEISQKSPSWSSDDDDWSAMKMSFENALSSCDVNRTKSHASNSKSKKLSSKVLGKRKLSIEQVISRGPSLKLARIPSLSPAEDKNSSKSKPLPSSDRRDSGATKKTLSSAQEKLFTRKKDSVSSMSDEDRFTSGPDEFSSSWMDHSGLGKSKKMPLVSPTLLADKVSAVLPKESSTIRIKPAASGFNNIKSAKSHEIQSPTGPPIRPSEITLNQLSKIKKITPEQKSGTPAVKSKKVIPEQKSVAEASRSKNNATPELKSVTPKVSSTSSRTTCQPAAVKVKAKIGIVKKKEPPPLTSKLFFSMMSSYVLTEQQLHDCGYPRPSEKEGVASIFYGDRPPPRVISDGPNCKKHECDRCHKQFSIYNNGHYKTIESCSYHYGRAFKVKEYGEGFVSRYTCCEERSGAPGCQTAKLHVTHGESLSEMPGYVTTPSRSVEASKCVYALDCEMCYTTEGLELTRVSVIDMTLKPVYEAIVRPTHTIVDYNTRFSGLTPKDFINVSKTITDVQRDLLKMFTSETILVGHSLESDMRALKIIHSQVVDTAIVFPHRMGLPYKRALKTLAKEHLHKFIQNDVDDGHDSLEDARACMELMLLKINGDQKSLCRRTINV